MLNSVSELVSKASADNQISDSEFNIVVREVQKYNELKAAISSDARMCGKKVSQPSPPDLEKIKKEIRGQVRSEFRKNLAAESKSDLRN